MQARFLLLLLATTSLPAQTPAPTNLIDQLVANAESYRITLPSLTASESIQSDASYLFFKHHADAKGTFRVTRASPEAQLVEARQLTEVDGKPVTLDQHPTLPTTMFGGFGRFQEMFFTPAHRPCYTFTELDKPGPQDTLQLAITQNPEPEPACNGTPRGVTGLALVDLATHQLRHLERTIPDDVAIPAHLAPFASVDLAPAKVGDQTYWLPTTVTGIIVNGKIHGKFVAHYSDYHRYTGTVKILPGITEVDSAPPPPYSP